MNDGRYLSVLEFFAVGNYSTAVLFGVVKDGGRSPQTKLSSQLKQKLCQLSVNLFISASSSLSSFSKNSGVSGNKEYTI